MSGPKPTVFGTPTLMASHDEGERVTHDPGRQFVLLLWRDKKIQAQEIPESDIPLRFKDSEDLDMLLDFVNAAVPGDSFPVRGERVLRFR